MSHGRKRALGCSRLGLSGGGSARDDGSFCPAFGYLKRLPVRQSRRRPSFGQSPFPSSRPLSVPCRLHRGPGAEDLSRGARGRSRRVQSELLPPPRSPFL